MSLRSAFMFIAPQGNPLHHVATVTAPEVEVITVALSEYASGRAAVGIVRSDHHPGLNHRSGDEIFQPA